mgnify:CR=1 FL=1
MALRRGNSDNALKRPQDRLDVFPAFMKVAGRRVLAVEDTSTTGGSVLTAVEALQEAGAEVVGVAGIVDRGAGDAVRAAGLAYRAAYTLADLGLPA